MSRTTLALRLILPALWIGILVAISFIEAPLKFQAPGITIPLGLGIGRLVFTAVNIVGAVILLVLTLLSLRPRPGRASAVLLAAIWVVLLVEVFVIRPPLNARTDLVLAGAEPGQSPWHYIYIAADLVLLALLVALLIVTVRALLPRGLAASVAAPQNKSSSV